MKKHLITASSLLLLFFSSCEKEAPLPPAPPPWSETEAVIRDAFDNYAIFSWIDYQRIMEKLQDPKFVVLPLYEMRKHFDQDKVVVGLRHDIDMNPFKALEMSEIEKSYGIRATYFVLATSYYYGYISSLGILRNEGMDFFYKKLHRNGAEIGIHNDLLTLMIAYGMNPYEFNKDELDWYKSIGIPIHGTASHGSPIASVTVPNFQIFSDFATSDSITFIGVRYPIGIKSLHDFGFEYEAYFINFDMYFSDSAGIWNDPDGLEGVLKKLDLAKPGQRIQILMHPVWWGKK